MHQKQWIAISKKLAGDGDRGIAQTTLNPAAPGSILGARKIKRQQGKPPREKSQGLDSLK